MFRVAALIALLAACEVASEPPLIGEPWTVETMPERRLEAGIGALGTRLVIAGGFSASMTEGLPITTQVLTFDTLLNQFDRLPDLPVAWTHANVAGVGGAVYVLGGLEGRSFVASGDAFVLEAGASEWTRLPSLPAGEERGAAAVVVSSGHIFLLGGAGTNEALATNLDFDIATRRWSLFPPALPAPRSHAAALRRFDGSFVIAGGFGGVLNPMTLADTLVLPQEATIWQIATAMPTPRGGCAYGSIYGNLICAGGENATEALAVNEIYDPTLDAWSTLEPMPEPRAGARGTVVTTRLYVPGGSASLAFEPTDTLFVFTPTAR